MTHRTTSIISIAPHCGTVKLPLAEWRTAVLAYATALTERLHQDTVIAHAIALRAADLGAAACEGILSWDVAARKEILFLSLLSRRIRAIETPVLLLDAPARVRIIEGNATQFALPAGTSVRAVVDARVIAAIEESDALVRKATLGEVPKLASGRIDLAADRCFGELRDALLRPANVPTPPLVAPKSERVIL